MVDGDDGIYCPLEAASKQQGSFQATIMHNLDESIAFKKRLQVLTNSAEALWHLFHAISFKAISPEK